MPSLTSRQNRHFLICSPQEQRYVSGSPRAGARISPTVVASGCEPNNIASSVEPEKLADRIYARFGVSEAFEFSGKAAFAGRDSTGIKIECFFGGSSST